MGEEMVTVRASGRGRFEMGEEMVTVKETGREKV